MSDTDGAADVSVVSPDGGSSSPVPTDRPDVDGNIAVDSNYKEPDEAIVNADDELDKDLEAIWDKHNEEDQKPIRKQPTDPASGRFIKAALAELEKNGIKPDDQQQEGADPALGAPLAMPKSWPAEKQELWTKIPPEGHKFLAERDQVIAKAFSEQGQVLAAYQPLGKLIADNQDLFEAHGAHPVDGINLLINAQRLLDRQPDEAVLALAKRYSPRMHAILEAALSGGQAVEGEDGATLAPSKAELELRQQVAELNRRLDSRETKEQTEARQREVADFHATKSQVEDWGKSQPYFNDVRKTMSALVINGEANSLPEAYEMACNANPRVRAAIRQAEKDTENAKRKAEEKTTTTKHVADAKRNASIQVGSGSPKMPKKASNGSWDNDGDLEALYDRIESGKR